MAEKPQYELDDGGRIIGREPSDGWRKLTPEQIAEDWEWFRRRQVEERIV